MVETTPAVERAAEALENNGDNFVSYLDGARTVLTAALDVEEMARALQESERATGDTARTWDEIPERWRESYRVDARHIRAALLGGAA